jgi:hypothetical protein
MWKISTEQLVPQLIFTVEVFGYQKNAHPFLSTFFGQKKDLLYHTRLYFCRNMMNFHGSWYKYLDTREALCLSVT